jgi:hypothetical protein
VQATFSLWEMQRFEIIQFLAVSFSPTTENGTGRCTAGVVQNQHNKNFTRSSVAREYYALHAPVGQSDYGARDQYQQSFISAADAATNTNCNISTTEQCTQQNLDFSCDWFEIAHFTFSVTFHVRLGV